MTIAAVYVLSFLTVPLLMIHGGIMDSYNAITSCLLALLLYACTFMLLAL